MHPASISLVGLALTTLSAAQENIVTLFVPGTENDPLVASIIGSDATATTYAIMCNPNPPPDDDGYCAVQGTMTLTEGPTTAKYTFPPVVDSDGETAFAGKFECSLAGTTSAVCIESYGGSQANHEGVSTETYAGTEQPYIPITITARAVGINRIASPTTGAGVDATQTSGVDADAGAGGGTSTEDTESSGDATTSSDSETEDVSTGDAAATSQRVGWVLGGAAMVLAML